jgi:hypothetical protein
MWGFWKPPEFGAGFGAASNLKSCHFLHLDAFLCDCLKPLGINGLLANSSSCMVMQEE